ncbi:MAG TPA: M48 family metallopeptidase [Candidatus Eremiobacteraeota bacterium]|nr:MAG: heat shock protein HtpX [bacterium ADurb.Bin363]HPZ08452.1 M48 family metallopeptidase [Candidatus Eremiobacteraeota bacterium]
MDRIQLLNLNSKEYEHLFDKTALSALQATPGLGTLIKKVNQYGLDKMLRIHYTGSYLKLNSRTFPAIDNIIKEACYILGITEIPDLYFQPRAAINAFTTCVEKPMIIITDGCINLLSEEELLFVLGHELGHIKSEHLIYQQLASVVPILADIIGTATLGIGKLLSGGLEIALLRWQRMSEFTADRAGLLVCQDVDIATKYFIKVAGAPKKYFESISVEDFMEQTKEFEGYDFGTLDKLAKLMCSAFQSEPWVVMRAAELYKWVNTGDFEKILNRELLSGKNHELSFCPYCGFNLQGNEINCGGCNKKI